MTTIEEVTNDFNEVLNLSKQHQDELRELTEHFFDKYSRRSRENPKDTLATVASRVFESQIRR